MRKVATGIQSFEKLQKKDLFYIDKTKFIREWWNSEDDVTLLTRPRRFGKTLMLDTVKTFFSPQFAKQSQLFEHLKIWQDHQFRALHGTIPVIFISFASIKRNCFADAVRAIKIVIETCYSEFRYLIERDNLLSENESRYFLSNNRDMPDNDVITSIYSLSQYIYRYHNKKPIILIDEYDTPFLEAWSKGYWDELIDFMRSFFNTTLKTNPWLERGLITGITRISKESIFSDLNNLAVVSTTSDHYADCFGFTEEEVFSAMDEYGLTDKEDVKKWYDGFTFGSQKEIYNPWSVIGYLKEKRLAPYWGQTSSNAVVGRLIAKAEKKVKEETSSLLRGESIVTKLDEQIVFSELPRKTGAIWSFLMAAGYVKPLAFDLTTNNYEITLTNNEVRLIFENLISQWFNQNDVCGSDFREALLTDDLPYMNKLLSEITEHTFSYFDTGGGQPELFYHGFVLGLIVDLKDRYTIFSNRESGLGRYDIIMLPKNPEDHGIVIEFKTMLAHKEQSLTETCQNALKQIREKRYTSELLSHKINPKNIYIYGFAFNDKKVLICGGREDKYTSKASKI